MFQFLMSLVLATGNSNYSTRESATEVLELLYPMSVPACLYGIRSLDPEVRARCSRVLRPLPGQLAYIPAIYWLYRPGPTFLDDGPEYHIDWSPGTRVLVYRAMTTLVSPDYGPETLEDMLGVVNQLRYKLRGGS